MIQGVIEELTTSNTPIMKPYYEHDGTKIIAVGLKKGVVLEKHTAPCKAQILIIKGAVIFKTEDGDTSLQTYDSFDISLALEHEVIGETDAVFLLILSR